MSLKKMRENAGLTQTDVARIMDVQQSTVFRWDSGTIPSKPYRKKLAKTYGCTVAELMEASKQKEANNAP